MNQNEHLNLQELKEKRLTLAARKQELSLHIRQCGISKNAQRFVPHKLDKDMLNVKNKLVEEYNQIELAITDVNKYIHKLSRREDEFKDIVKTNFPSEIYESIIAECKRRDNGEPPQKVKFNFAGLQDSKLTIQKQKEKILQYFNIITDARERLNEYIEQNCPEKNKSEFMAKIVKLNISLPNLATMNLDRRKNNF